MIFLWCVGMVVCIVWCIFFMILLFFVLIEGVFVCLCVNLFDYVLLFGCEWWFFGVFGVWFGKYGFVILMMFCVDVGLLYCVCWW